ncbi:hypothetical protein PoB_007193100 [Plakobranchus ocellatus]|uniref:Uncharacterized protein n=1 Tax=Plakobranchus ocellatus TaxID=259542 RepID=A0AAV4DMR4_9GAST|nr:hypothetical protein PoB_007193100 [Plakobranchus ocellatus]
MAKDSRKRPFCCVVCMKLNFQTDGEMVSLTHYTVTQLGRIRMGGAGKGRHKCFGQRRINKEMLRSSNPDIELQALVWVKTLRWPNIVRHPSNTKIKDRQCLLFHPSQGRIPKSHPILLKISPSQSSSILPQFISLKVERLVARHGCGCVGVWTHVMKKGAVRKVTPSFILEWLKAACGGSGRGDR